MPAFKFEALDAAGKSSTGLLEAENAKAARSQLRAQALVPLAVTPVLGGSAAAERDQPLLAPRLRHHRRWRCGRGRWPGWSAPGCRWNAR